MSGDVNEDIQDGQGVKVLQDGRRCDKSPPSPASWLIYNLLLLPRLPMSGSTTARAAAAAALPEGKSLTVSIAARDTD